MTVELISVGTEILLGNIVNTNSAFLAERCATLGLDCYYQIAVGDNPNRLEQTIRTAIERSDVVILTGGLGPTVDDITKEIVAKAFEKELVIDENSKRRIQEFFDKLGARRITENNWKQAYVPKGSIVIDNHNGSAPGIIVEDSGKVVILMPGPPNEMIPMFENDIEAYLRKLTPESLYSKMVKICNIGESAAESMIIDILEAQSNPTIAPYAKTGEVHLRVTAKAETKDEADELMAPTIDELYKRFGNNIFTTDEKVSFEESIVSLAKEKGLTITTAESCTGGLLSGRLINVAGISDIYKEGFVTYSNEAKERAINVSHETLEKYGAVSEETACEMALGAVKTSGADIGVSVTGIAGPTGATEGKPVGLVYIGVSDGTTTYAKKFNFFGDRRKNRDYSVVKALSMLSEVILCK